MPEQFSAGLRDRAVRMVYERQARLGGPRAASIRVVALQLGVGQETLRIWCNRQGPTDFVGLVGPLEEENGRLRRELAQKRHANEILKAATVIFAAEPDLPTKTITTAPQRPTKHPTPTPRRPHPRPTSHETKTRALQYPASGGALLFSACRWSRARGRLCRRGARR